VIQGISFEGNAASGPAIRAEKMSRWRLSDIITTKHGGPAFELIACIENVFLNVHSTEDEGGLHLKCIAGGPGSNANRFYEFRVMRATEDWGIKIEGNSNGNTFYGGLVELNHGTGMLVEGLPSDPLHDLNLYGVWFESNAVNCAGSCYHLLVQNATRIAVEGCNFGGVNVDRRILMSGVDYIQITSNHFGSGNVADIEHDAQVAWLHGNNWTKGPALGSGHSVLAFPKRGRFALKSTHDETGQANTWNWRLTLAGLGNPSHLDIYPDRDALFRWRESDTGPVVASIDTSDGGAKFGSLSVTADIQTEGDLEVTDSAKGLILRSPNGSLFRVTVDDSGNLVTNPL
jgi:hypothetical protein